MTNVDPILGLVSDFGSIGFVFLLVWRTTNFTIPRIAKAFEDSIAATRADFKSALSEQRQDFKEALAEQRNFFNSQIQANRAQLERIASEFAKANSVGCDICG